MDNKLFVFGRKTVRFGGNLETAIINFNNGIKKNYDILIEELCDPDAKSSYLLQCYQDATTNAHLLDWSHTKMVNAFLKVRWMEREPEVIVGFCNFAIALITSNPVHLQLVLKALINCFLPGYSTEGNSNALLFNNAVYENVHNVLKTIFALIPQSSLVIEKVFKESFPYMRKSHLALEWYVKNLLYVTTYYPTLRLSILRIIINNVVSLDVHSPRTDIEAEEDSANDKDDYMFEMDEDAKLQDTNMKHELANKLDILLSIILQYILDSCYKEGNLQVEESRKLLREVVAVFDDVILPVHQTNHVQFMIFYMCSFKQSFVESFVEHCWKKVIDINAPLVIRQASVSYIASLLARAKYVPLSMIRCTLDLMISWSHRYLKAISDASSYSESHFCDVTKHGTFYSVCQAIFYIIIFRHNQILESSLGHKYIQSLNLQRLVVSNLNPLKACLSSVVVLFASTMRIHQLVYCDTIIERNNRQMLPVAGNSTLLETRNPLESFFPFDPCLLKRCLVYISPLYIEWKGAVPVDRSDDEESDSEFLNVVDASSSSHTKHSLSISPGFGFNS